MRLQENERTREAERARVTQSVDEALNELSGKYQWESVYIFGSIAKSGKFGKGSDVDIAVEGLDGFSLYSLIGDISMMLKRNVDVILLEECPFAEKIKEQGIPWTPKNR
jgi:predicted nucleotidyltransferase